MPKLACKVIKKLCFIVFFVSNQIKLFILNRKEGDGKTTRELLAMDMSMMKHVKFRPGTKDIKDQFLLENEGNSYF